MFQAVFGHTPIKNQKSNSKKNPGYCQAVGGWHVSARELAAYVANCSASQTIVSSQMRAKMYDDDNRDEMLVWSFTINDAWATENFGMNRMPYMGGDCSGCHATIVMLPNGYYAVALVNSGGMNSGDVTRAIVDSFKASVTF